MGKKNKIIKINKTANVSDILIIIMEHYFDFQKTTDSDERMDHMMEVVFGLFLYIVVRYDYRNYLKLRENEEDTTNE